MRVREELDLHLGDKRTGDADAHQKLGNEPPGDVAETGIEGDRGRRLAAKSRCKRKKDGLGEHVRSVAEE